MNNLNKETQDWQQRTRLLIGDIGVKRLNNAHVLVAGLGGVGAFAAEMLCRAGIGTLTLCDADTVQATNRNRQIPALISTLGQPKSSVMRERLLDINPQLRLFVYQEFIRDDRTNELLDNQYDYVIDAIDTLSPKIFFIYRCMLNGLPLVSSMGAGGKMDPSHIRLDDFSRTNNCKLARILRKRLKRLGVTGGFKAVYSDEDIIKESMMLIEGESNKKSTTGTISYMPSMFGAYCASAVIRDLISAELDKK